MEEPEGLHVGMLDVKVRTKERPTYRPTHPPTDHWRDSAFEIKSPCACRKGARSTVDMGKSTMHHLSSKLYTRVETTQRMNEILRKLCRVRQNTFSPLHDSETEKEKKAQWKSCYDDLHCFIPSSPRSSSFCSVCLDSFDSHPPTQFHPLTHPHKRTPRVDLGVERGRCSRDDRTTFGPQRPACWSCSTSAPTDAPLPTPPFCSSRFAERAGKGA